MAHKRLHLSALIIAGAITGGGFCLVVPASSAESNPFDGTWRVKVNCSDAPDGAKGYSWNFPVLCSTRHRSDDGRVRTIA